MSDHIDAALDGAGVCDGGRDGAGVCLLLLVVDAISGRAAALAAGPLHVNFVVPFLLRYTALVSTQLPGQRMPLRPWRPSQAATSQIYCYYHDCDYYHYHSYCHYYIIHIVGMRGGAAPLGRGSRLGRSQNP